MAWSRGGLWCAVARGAALAVLVLLCAQTGCVKELDEESPRSGRLGQVTGDCLVPLPPELESWGAPVSVEFPERSLWIWSDVTLAGGASLRNVGAYVTDVAGACAGEMTLVADASAMVTPLVTLTPAEEQDNVDRTDGRHVALEITGGFVDQGQAYVYYDKVVRGPGFFDAEVLGMGLCTISGPGDTCVRQRPELYPEEPTLLWGRTRRTLNQGAVVDGDGYAYVMGCFHVADFEDLCSLARVLPVDAADPTAYRYRDVFSGWVADPWEASVILESAGRVTPGYLPHLDRYLLVVVNLWDSAVEAHLARDRGGEYDRAGVLFEAVPPSGLLFITGGAEHAALRTDEGRTVAVSYFTDGADAAGLHLVTFRFAEDL